MTACHIESPQHTPPAVREAIDVALRSGASVRSVWADFEGAGQFSLSSLFRHARHSRLRAIEPAEILTDDFSSTDGLWQLGSAYASVAKIKQDAEANRNVRVVLAASAEMRRLDERLEARGIPEISVLEQNAALNAVIREVVHVTRDDPGWGAVLTARFRARHLDDLADSLDEVIDASRSTANHKETASV